MVLNKIKRIMFILFVFCVFTIIVIPQSFAMSWKDWWLTRDQQGYQALNQAQPQIAARLFTRSDWRAATYYQMADYQRALQEWDQLLSEKTASTNKNGVTNNKMSLSEIYYNRGNTLAQLNSYQEAIKSYEQSLSLDPTNEDATFNLALIKQLLKQQNPSSASANDKPSPPSKNNKSSNDNSSNQNSPQSSSKNNTPPQNPSMNTTSTNSLTNNDNNNNQHPLQQWLNKVPDDPGGLLKQKFLRDERREELQQFLNKLGDTRV